MGFYDDDICWCGNSDVCSITECFRHMSNRKPQTPPDIFTQAAFMNTPDCPYYEEQEQEQEEEEVYQLTPWGCLYSVLLDYGVDLCNITGKIGEHIIDDFMEGMEKMGYISKIKTDEDNL